ncbi:MAG: NAD(P)/FAD-dependent oxidoreductase [Ilumatobacteraceae bacterium]
MTSHRVVIIGAGFGGLAVARALADVDVDVTLVDANNFHTFQPLLYQVASAGLDAVDIGSAVRGILRRQRNVTFRMGRVVGADLEQRSIHLDDEMSLAYDTLVLAAGAVTNTFGIDGVDEHAFPLKSIDEALALRVHVLAEFENAAVQPHLVDDGVLNVVVCGGGPTGVEMSGAFMELFTKVLARDFSQLDVSGARVVLIEGGDRLLAPFHPKTSARALRTLTERGVEVRLGVGVDRVEAAAVHLDDGTRIPTHTTVWAAGVKASPLAAALGLTQAHAGRIVVERDLSVGGHPEIFAIGDIAASLGDDGVSLLPQVAPTAIQGGKHVAAQIVNRLAGRSTTAFSYRDKGSMATIGRNHAVAELPGGLRLHGRIGWLSWMGLHIVYLIGFRNRISVLVNWAWNYLTYDRGSRLLSERAHRDAE